MAKALASDAHPTDTIGNRGPKKIRLVDVLFPFVFSLRSADELNAFIHGRFPYSDKTDHAAPTKSNTAETSRGNKVNTKSDKLVDPKSRTNGSAATNVSEGTKRPSGPPSVAVDHARNERNINLDPISGIEELCAQRKWRRPQYKYGGVATGNQKSASHSLSHTMICVVTGDNEVEYSAKGVAGKKANAKRVAAMKVYAQMIKDVSPRT